MLLLILRYVSVLFQLVKNALGTLSKLSQRLKLQPHPANITPTVAASTHILNLLPAAKYLVYVCSAGSLGYNALKETLQNGVPGNTLLIESDDLGYVVSPYHAVMQKLFMNAPDDAFLRESRNLCAAQNMASGFKCPFLLHTFKPNDDWVTHSFFAITGGTPVRKSYFREVVPHRVKSAVIYCNLTVLPCFMMEKYYALTSLALKPMPQVRVIQGCFLEGCCALRELDLSPLSQVTKIESSFLSGCVSLQAVDLSPFSQVTEVGLKFLMGCTGLTSINLEPLSKLTKIPWAFLAECSGLTMLNLSPLSQVAEVGDSFLFGNINLKEINLGPLSKVRKINANFLNQCVSLTSTSALCQT